MSQHKPRKLELRICAAECISNFGIYCIVMIGCVHNAMDIFPWLFPQENDFHCFGSCDAILVERGVSSSGVVFSLGEEDDVEVIAEDEKVEILTFSAESVAEQLTFMDSVSRAQ